MHLRSRKTKFLGPLPQPAYKDDLALFCHSHAGIAKRPLTHPFKLCPYRSNSTLSQDDLRPFTDMVIPGANIAILDELKVGSPLTLTYSASIPAWEGNHSGVCPSLVHFDRTAIRDFLKYRPLPGKLFLNTLAGHTVC